MRRVFCCWVIALTCCASAYAAPTPPLPEDPDQWVNGEQVSPAALKGKVTVLYFYEETCPHCSSKWPGLRQDAEAFKDKPLVFIAVNSGNPAPSVAGYARGRIPWPVIADTNREFEKLFKFGEIHNDNCSKVRIIGPDGKMYNGNPDEFKATLERYADKAKWKVDPVDLPDTLKDTWRAVEFCDYKSAIPTLNKAMKSSNEAYKTGAQKLYKQIESDLDALISQAESAQRSGKKWEAYKLYQEASRTFAGMPKAEDAAKQVKTLAAEEELKDEVRALSLLEQAKKLLENRIRNKRREGLTMLDSIARQYPKTEAGQEAQKLKETAAE